MPLGPGIYDAECTRIRESADAAAVILIVIGSKQGTSGMSCQVQTEYVLNLPKILRDVAQQIEDSGGGTA